MTLRVQGARERERERKIVTLNCPPLNYLRIAKRQLASAAKLGIPHGGPLPRGGICTSLPPLSIAWGPFIDFIKSAQSNPPKDGSPGRLPHGSCWLKAGTAHVGALGPATISLPSVSPRLGRAASAEVSGIAGGPSALFCS